MLLRPYTNMGGLVPKNSPVMLGWECQSWRHFCAGHSFIRFEQNESKSKIITIVSTVFFVFFGWFVSSQTFVLRRFCSKKITQMHTKSRSATKKDHGFMINCAEKSFQDLSFKWKRVGNPNLSTRWRRLLFHQRCGVHFGSEGLPKKGSWVGSC